MITDLAARFAPADITPEIARSPLLRSIRLWLKLAPARRNPRPVLSALLGKRSAAAFGLFMEAAVDAWTSPFIAFTPSAEKLSVDEATLLNLLAAAEAGDLGAGHALLAEMLPLRERDRLFLAAERVMDEVAPIA